MQTKNPTHFKLILFTYYEKPKMEKKNLRNKQDHKCENCMEIKRNIRKVKKSNNKP